MDNKEELSLDNKKIKRGCLTWAVILILSPFMIFGGIFSYEMYFKERQLGISTSSNGNNMIEIVEKGSAFLFGSSKVRIKYDGRSIDRMISNDGATLSSSNVFVSWINADKAVVTLFGDEQKPENIEIDLSQKDGKVVINGEGEPAFKPFTAKISDSPSSENKIEIKEMTALPDEGHGFHSIRIYYGNKESDLKKYEEYIPFENQVTFVDEYRVNWINEEQVSIDVMLKNQDFELFIYDTIKLDLMQ